MTQLSLPLDDVTRFHRKLDKVIDRVLRDLAIMQEPMESDTMAILLGRHEWDQWVRLFSSMLTVPDPACQSTCYRGFRLIKTDKLQEISVAGYRTLYINHGNELLDL